MGCSRFALLDEEDITKLISEKDGKIVLIFYYSEPSRSRIRKEFKPIRKEKTFWIIQSDTSIKHPPTNMSKKNRMSIVLRFLVALKAAKTFATVVAAVLTFCILTPTVVRPIIEKFCDAPCRKIWFVVLNYQIYGINSVVNAFIYGMRHARYRKPYLHILFKLFSCHKATTT